MKDCLLALHSLTLEAQILGCTIYCLTYFVYINRGILLIVSTLEEMNV